MSKVKVLPLLCFPLLLPSFSLSWVPGRLGLCRGFSWEGWAGLQLALFSGTLVVYLVSRMGRRMESQSIYVLACLAVKRSDRSGPECCWRGAVPWESVSSVKLGRLGSEAIWDFNWNPQSPVLFFPSKFWALWLYSWKWGFGIRFPGTECLLWSFGMKTRCFFFFFPSLWPVLT